jgi:putative oxidoreductase
MDALGRALFSAIFIVSSLGLLFAKPRTQMAKKAGVPFAELTVPLAGALALAGGLSVLLGYHARIGATLLVAFLLPVSAFMHPFWAVSDPMGRQMQKASFMKNVALVGAALLIACFGAGAHSLDAWKGR